MNRPGRAILLLVWLLATACSERVAVRPPPLGKLPEPLAAAPPPSPLAAIAGTPDDADQKVAVGVTPPPIRRLGASAEPLLTAYPIDDLENLVLNVHPEAVRQPVVDAYVARDGAWIWSDGRTLSTAAQRLLTLIAEVEDHGVRPGLIDAEVTKNLGHAVDWNAQVIALGGASDDASARLGQLRTILLAELDMRLTASALALARVLDVTDKSGPELAQSLPTASGLDAFVRGLIPADPRYLPLTRALRRYSRYAAFPEVPASLDAVGYHLGVREPGVDALRRRLYAEGFSSGPWPEQADVFDRTLDELVRRFEWSRGLPTDGVVDRAALDALSVPPTELASAIVEAERVVRRSSLRDEPRHVLVNLPEFTTVLVDGGRVVRRFRAIVGYAYGTGGGRTKLIASSIDHVTINPGWTPSDWIIDNELRPKEKASPGYLSRLGFRPFTRPDGRYGLYQLPGDQNALGRVTVNFANELAIYLHGTPDEAPFALATRAMSHGCVRVQDIEGLARSILEMTGTMSGPDFERTLDARKKVDVPLASPVPMAIEYVRVVVAEDGLVRFLPNIYRQ